MLKLLLKNSLSLRNNCYYLTKFPISTFEKTQVFKKNNTEYAIKSNFKDNGIEFTLQLHNKKVEKKLPHIWLRDLCKCSECFNEKTEEKTLDLAKIAINTKPLYFRESDKKGSFDIACNYNLVTFY